ncbi:ABC transporter transmembrane domain-containing protein [Paenibacillus thiaminolyticus]|uniref:ABC transporter transmembrane domain-containing protein n=1 Tax=Paenibacillus thiaminolyticus TaxID=49283 RepID=UPI003D29C2A7
MLQPRNIGTALLWLVIALACTEIVLVIGQIARGSLGVRIGARLMGEIRSDVYRSLMGMSLAFFDRRQTSQFISRVNNDSEQMRQFLTDGLIWVGGNAVKFIAIIVMMLSLDWQLTLFAILPMPLIIFSLCGYSRRFGSCGTGNGAPIFHLNVQVGDSLSRIRVVKAFGQSRWGRTGMKGRMRRRFVKIFGWTDSGPPSSLCSRCWRGQAFSLPGLSAEWLCCRTGYRSAS